MLDENSPVFFGDLDARHAQRVMPLSVNETAARRRWKTWLGTGAAILCGVVCGLALGLQYNRRADTPAQVFLTPVSARTAETDAATQIEMPPAPEATPAAPRLVACNDGPAKAPARANPEDAKSVGAVPKAPPARVEAAPPSDLNNGLVRPRRVSAPKDRENPAPRDDALSVATKLGLSQQNP
jgi:hypothetical protein